MGCFSLLIYNTTINLDNITVFNKVVVYVEKKLTPEREKEIDEELRALENIKSIEFVSKEQALTETRAKMFKDRQSTVDIFKNDNPLRDSYNIEFEDIDNIDTYLYRLSNIKDITINDKTADAKKIRNMVKFVSFILFGFLIILLIISVFIILNTIKLSVHIRKNEITLMRYIGATNGFILFPFLLEGMIIGGVSAFLAFLIQQYIYSIVQSRMTNADFELIIVKFSEVGLLILAGFLIVGIISGLIGSSISARKYLKA